MSKIDPRMTNARSSLIIGQPFFGTMALHLDVVEMPSIGTMATDGKKLFYAPAFLDRQTPAKIKGTWAHEVLHNANKHHLRRGDREHELWNDACDYAINPILIDAGFELPDNVLIDRKFEGMSAEEIYARLIAQREIERHQQAQQRQDDEDSDDDEGDDDENEGDDGSADDGSGDAGDQADSGGAGQPGTGSSAQPGSPGKGAKGLGGSQGAGASNGPAGPGEPGGEPQGPGSTGNGPTDGPATAETGSSPGPKPAETMGSAQPGLPADSAPKPGGRQGWGQVIDCPGDGNELDIDVAIQQAIAVASNDAGSVPGYLERLVAERKQDNVDWRTIVHRFVDDKVVTDYTWSRPNRRFAHSGLVMPSSIIDGVGKVGLLVDVSGSIDDEAFNKFTSAMQTIMDLGKIRELIVVCIDTYVRSVTRFGKDEDLVINTIGGGGTEFAPGFEWFAEEEPDVSAIIYFTDLRPNSNFWGKEPSCPVLWAAWGFESDVKELSKKVPFGEVVYISEEAA